MAGWSGLTASLRPLLEHGGAVPCISGKPIGGSACGDIKAGARAVGLMAVPTARARGTRPTPCQAAGGPSSLQPGPRPASPSCLSSGSSPLTTLNCQLPSPELLKSVVALTTITKTIIVILEGVGGRLSSEYRRCGPCSSNLRLLLSFALSCPSPLTSQLQT